MTAKNILYLNHVSEMGGGEYCLLNLMKNLDRRKFIPTLLLQEPGHFSELAKKFNIETHFLKMPGWRKIKNVFYNRLKILPKLKKLVKTLNIDLLHCNAYRLNPYGVLTAKSARIPCISNIKWFTQKSHIKNFYLDKADILITVSDYIASFFAGSAANVKTIYDGIEPERFFSDNEKRDKIRRELKIGREVKLTGMVAQITPRKGHKDFIKAAALVKKLRPEAKFLVVGGAIIDKELSLEELKDYAKNEGAGNVIFLGQRHDVADIFSALDCFVLPSHIEPFAGVIMEAMAAKVPVIATRSGGATEIISDGINGMLVPVKAPDLIAQKVIELLTDTRFAARIAEEAYLTVTKKFTIKHTVESMQAVYEGLLN